MNQIRSLSEFTWCPKLPDFILVSSNEDLRDEKVACTTSGNEPL